MTPDIHALAEQISKGGFKWVEDGKLVQQILVILKRQLGPVKDKVVLRTHLVSSLMLLDRQHGWKTANQTQEQEDAMYGCFVDLLLK